jgi:hypothetical protein
LRSIDWPSLLINHLEASADSLFVWGKNDCALWCADWILTITGNDLAHDLRGKYSTQLQADTLLKNMGFDTVADYADKLLKTQPITLAQRGDIVLHPQGALGICDGHFSHFLMSIGLTTIPTLRCQKSWKVD